MPKDDRPWVKNWSNIVRLVALNTLVHVSNRELGAYLIMNTVRSVGTEEAIKKE